VHIQSSYDLLYALKKLNYLETTRDFLWWPNSGTFEVIVGAILTQQTKWEKVEESLYNLERSNLLSLESLRSGDLEQIAACIKPSGFIIQKPIDSKLLAVISSKISVLLMIFKKMSLGSGC